MQGLYWVVQNNYIAHKKERFNTVICSPIEIQLKP